ncbi:MAG: hypothetical protein E3J35_00255 [Methanomassiliicoccales archaeon]|nr:MAG: hypothetical protein E3J35_00255 [Methanomassiliicoccales archaeon]
MFLTLGIILTTRNFSFLGISDRSTAIIAFWAMWLFGLAPFAIWAGLIGMEVDGIYEKGISSRQTTLFGHLRGKGFVPYDSITAIRLERIDTPKGTTEKITIYGRDSDRPAIDPFMNTRYKNDFWNRLKNALRTNCRNAKWTVED